MAEISVTVTVGEGSERHNHDLDYRATLKHVHEMENGVIELVPYTKDYHSQINELLKPYIDEYNKGVDQRYQEAWERYNAGQIKTKPRKRDYKHMEYDYCAAHKDDYIKNPVTGKREQVPLFRELIIGFGDKEDRELGRITEEQAKKVAGDVVEHFREKFPNFRILGASLHLDEGGFYHMHLNYKPVMDAEFSKGLQCTVSQDTVLEKMGYEPEQSIINESDKAPIRFNAFRNEIYRFVEESFADVGLRLMYGASKVKEPEKDSSVNQQLPAWQATQDAARELQHLKNVMLDTVAADKVSPEGFKQAVTAADNITRALDEIERQPRSRWNKNQVLVSFHLFDQLKSFVKDMVETVRHLLQKIDILSQNLDIEHERAEELERENAKLRPLAKYDDIDFKLKMAAQESKAEKYDKLLDENLDLKRQLSRYDPKYFNEHMHSDPRK